MRDTWTEWLRAEKEHFRADRTRDRADVIVDGAPTLSHDPAVCYVRLS